MVYCINKGKIKNLTEGKRYKVIRKTSTTHKNSKKPSDPANGGFWIINDSGIVSFYSSKRFLDIEEHRDIILNELINPSCE